MTPDIIAVLTANGITPPKQGHKTTCPRCSHYRLKDQHRCLKIRLTRRGVIWVCFHCHWEGPK